MTENKLLDPSKYLEYIDKEMTIMGVLSAATIGVVGAVLGTLLSGKDTIGNSLWPDSSSFFILGSFFGVIAALMFYWQRSLLAWFYGQICLDVVHGADGKRNEDIDVKLKDADSLPSWVRYSWGFNCLVAGLLECMLGLSYHLWLPVRSLFAWHYSGPIYTLVGLLVLICAGWLQWYVFDSFPYSDDHWRDFWRSLRKGEYMRPHDNVFTRLEVSQLHGVGVFALIDIPEGTSLFEPDDAPTVLVDRKGLVGLPDKIMKLYYDFCPRKGDAFECPQSFNSLTQSWYLNFSKTPNTRIGANLKFYASREIKAGEELTADYASYSDSVPDCLGTE